MANNTEQKRIATALETMAGIEPTKGNETEQQRIAAAVESIAEGGGGGGGGVMIANITEEYDEEGEEYLYLCDKTYNEIKSFVDAGGMCYLRYNSVSGVKVLSLVDDQTGESFGEPKYVFTCANYSSGALSLWHASVSLSNYFDGKQFIPDISENHINLN